MKSEAMNPSPIPPPCAECGQPSCHTDRGYDFCQDHNVNLMSITFSIEGLREESPTPRFEMNLATGNAYALLSFLGVDPDFAGWSCPVALQAALRKKSAQAGELVSADYSGPGYVRFGLSPEQVDRYLWTLTRIAKQAEKYRRKVIWG